MNKKIATMTATILMVSSLLIGCKSRPVFNDGIYEGAGEGKNGELKVEVTVNKGKISGIKIVEHKETPGLSDEILKKVPEAIIKAQSTEVDNISGATITTKAIKDAVDNALKNVK
jgi:Uncharacterized protein conserved in bacteria